MNFLLICLHSLDMRDFHSNLRHTPFLDDLRSQTQFMPMGRAQGHNQNDSLNAEITGMWSSRHIHSVLSEDSFKITGLSEYPTTIMERLQKNGYDIITHMKVMGDKRFGSAAPFFLNEQYFAKQPQRMNQFTSEPKMTLEKFVSAIKNSDKFYAHIMLRDTHRPWAQKEGLGALAGQPEAQRWPEDASYARKLALTSPDEFAALRRRGLALADAQVKNIFELTKDVKDLVYVVYSNHGEVLDHFRYNQAYASYDINRNNKTYAMINGTSHGLFPYEPLYANMQMWRIPNSKPKLIAGLSRSIDIPATILDLANIDSDPMDGESMLPYFSKGFIPRRDRYAEVAFDSNSESGAISLVRHDGFKYLWSKAFRNHAPAIFDLNSDPNEQFNMLSTTVGQDILQWAIKTHQSLKPEPKKVNFFQKIKNTISNS